jgi:hypothetical protein
MSLTLIGPIFSALEKGLVVWDFYNKTKYAREYRKLRQKLSEEEAKPVYGDMHMDELRDQSKIDKMHFDLDLLLRMFIKDEGKNGDKIKVT